MYLRERENWTNFRLDNTKITFLLEIAAGSSDTANRDIQDLLEKNILKEDIPGAKRPSYSIVYDPEDISGMSPTKIALKSDRYSSFYKIVLFINRYNRYII